MGKGDSVRVSSPAIGAAKAISAEVGGTNLIGVSYDGRFQGNWGWGYRVGMGYDRDVDKMGWSTMSATNSGSSWQYKSTARGFGIPLEINYLAGRRLHQFEVGAGTVLGYYKEKNRIRSLELTSQVVGNETTVTTIETTVRWNRKYFGWYAYGNVGYRFHCKRGFLLRLGTLVAYGEDDHTPYRGQWSIRPYLGLGYTFPNAAIGHTTDVRRLQVPDSTRIRGYRGFGELQGGVTQSSPFLAITTSHGFRFNRQWFLGAGIGLTTEGVPVFANARFNMTKRQTAPVLDAKVGYTFEYIDAPLYTTVGFGVDHRFTRKLALSFMLNYLRVEGENGWTLQLGVEF
ncbi:MAG: hypothetical protein IJ064_02005 [Bacteroidaceae bacterium]|nr:hypothetical protein [Bacteroidaceae bacterium]